MLAYGVHKPEQDYNFDDDPDTLILFDFESQNGVGLNKRADSPNGAIIGAQWTRGRWPGIGALNFKRVTDRVRLNIPGSYDAITNAGTLILGI